MESREEQTTRGRHETPLAKADRNLNELLQELRVAQTGVQVLFAFLLGVPFTQRFTTLTHFERTAYYGAVLLAAAGALLLIAPTSYHRLLFHQGDKPHIVRIANRFAIGGLACVALAVTVVVMLVTSVLYGSATVAAAGGAVAALWLLTWLVAPLLRRWQIETGRIEGSNAELCEDEEEDG
jgi:hypothetical protein